MNKKALSPLIATLLLVVFALVIGTATMNWGKAYVENISEEPAGDSTEINSPSIVIPYEDIMDNDLKQLQIKYITGKISKQEYLIREKELLND